MGNLTDSAREEASKNVYAIPAQGSVGVSKDDPWDTFSTWYVDVDIVTEEGEEPTMVLKSAPREQIDHLAHFGVYDTSLSPPGEGVHKNSGFESLGLLDG